jgi:hypothetical protein
MNLFGQGGGRQPTATACVTNFYLGKLQLWAMIPPRQRNMYSIISCTHFCSRSPILWSGLNALDLIRKKKYVYKSSEVNHVALQQLQVQLPTRIGTLPISSEIRGGSTSFDRSEEHWLAIELRFAPDSPLQAPFFQILVPAERRAGVAWLESTSALMT